MSKVKHLKVAQADDGQRLDRWLKKQLPGTPYGLIQKLMRSGQVRVEGKRAKADTRLTAGQDVRLPPVESREEKENRPLSQQDKAYIKSLVLYDDGDILAINKPYGLPTQGGSGIYRHVDFYLDGLKDKQGTAPRLVHRLDKDTSGVLLLARSAKAVRELGRMFKGRDIRKIYWAITVPAPEMQDGEIKGAIGPGVGAKKDLMVLDSEDAKPATTLFEVLEFASKKCAFVAFWPRTGRKHQIRVHAAQMGCPILGDVKYGYQVGEIEVSEDMGMADRLHLHAKSVSFKHPVTGKMLSIEAPLADDLRKSWKALGFNPAYKQQVFTDIALL